MCPGSTPANSANFAWDNPLRFLSSAIRLPIRSLSFIIQKNRYLLIMLSTTATISKLKKRIRVPSLHIPY